MGRLEEKANICIR